MRPGSVTLLYCYAREVEGAFMDSYVSYSITSHAWRVCDLERGGGAQTVVGSRIAHNRNELVRLFLEGPGEWAMMMDTDHTWAPDAIDRLIETAHELQTPETPGAGKIVGGLCFGGIATHMAPTMYRMTPDRGVITVDDWLPNEVVECSATGAAFLLVHRDVLETMRDHYAERHPCEWFGEGIHPTANGNIELGEDWFFCVAARRLGFAVHVDTAVEAPHMKAWVLSSLEWDKYKERRRQWGTDAIVEQAADLRAGIVTPIGSKESHHLNRAERRRLERVK